jgi:tetratricopeptide (TPR) repeat protein
VGNRQKALEEYQKGIEIEPDNYSLSYSMGYCLFENGSYEEAKACF